MNEPDVGSRGPRFSLGFAFVLMSVVAVCLFAARKSDWISGLGLFIAYVVAVVAMRLPHWPFRRLVRYACLAIAFTIAWFASVDRYSAFERCRFCDSHHNTREYRLLGVPISNAKLGEHGDLWARMASDLGKPCSHEYARYPLTREWGLVYCARPCIGITCCFGQLNGYDPQRRQRVIRLRREHPEAADEFSEWLRTGWEKDYAWLKTFYQRLEESPTSATPPADPLTGQ